VKLYILIIQENVEQFSLEKLIVHCCHNASRTELDCYKRDVARWQEWIKDEETKILLWVKDLITLRAICAEASQLHITYTITEDAGFKETPKGTILGGAIGPMSDAEANALGLKKLRLFKYK
jgi:peptidyl-tRNA hydrolase